MESEIKKYIDSLKKRRIKTELVNLESNIPKSEKDQIKVKVEALYQYDKWLKGTLSQGFGESYFPHSNKQVELYELLMLEVSYKQSFKSLCDSRHPIIYEVLKKLSLDDDQIESCIDSVRQLNSEPLNYYALFKDELRESLFSLKGVLAKIDQLADDCFQGAIVSHSAKMSNPSCKYPKIFIKGKLQKDGFIKTGNSPVDFDIHINATKLKVFKFLSLKYQGVSLLDHISNNKNTIFQELFCVSEEKEMEWARLFSVCIENQDYRTDRLIKQTYFPIDAGYHLLSLLQPSGLVFALKEKIDLLNGRSPNAYLGNKYKKDNLFFDKGFSTVSNLTVTKHGGDHPKNISGLNNKYQNYYLLSSLPPSIEKRDIHFPKSDFFIESFKKYDYADTFKALHKLFQADYNNINIRNARDRYLQDIMDSLIEKMWAVRSISKEQFHKESSSLSSHQIIWLYSEYEKERVESEQWLDKVVDDISRWISRSYEKVLAKQAITLGEEERLLFVNVVEQNREFLK